MGIDAASCNDSAWLMPTLNLGYVEEEISVKRLTGRRVMERPPKPGRERPMTQRDWGKATPYENVTGEVAIVGIGETEHTARSGRAPLAMAMEAAERAIADAVLNPREVDGL